jgi:myosin heavy subunit
MNIKRLSAIFLPLLLTFSIAQGQYQNHYAPCESEITNLKEQIERIILDSQRSLEEADAKLLASLQRINVLETENEKLREVNSGRQDFTRRGRRKIAEKLQETEAAVARLTDQKQALEKQLESLQEVQLQEESGYASALESARRSDKYQLRQQRDEYRRMESSLDHAYKEMVLLKAELRAAKSKAETLQEENIEIRRWADTQKKNFDQRLRVMETELEEAKAYHGHAYTSSIRYQQVVDSLKFELTSLSRMVDILNQGERVEKNRFARVDAQEKDLEETKFKLEIREQLLFSREKDLSQRQAELELKEKKYENLQEKEKELKLLEQRLRQYSKADMSRGN